MNIYSEMQTSKHFRLWNVVSKLLNLSCFSDVLISNLVLSVSVTPKESLNIFSSVSHLFLSVTVWKTTALLSLCVLHHHVIHPCQCCIPHKVPQFLCWHLLVWSLSTKTQGNSVRPSSVFLHYIYYISAHHLYKYTSSLFFRHHLILQDCDLPS